jgi:hypothetical protein
MVRIADDSLAAIRLGGIFARHARIAGIADIVGAIADIDRGH